MHPSSAGLTSRFHDVCACDGALEDADDRRDVAEAVRALEARVGVADRRQVGLVGVEARAGDARRRCRRPSTPSSPPGSRRLEGDGLRRRVARRPCTGASAAPPSRTRRPAQPRALRARARRRRGSPRRASFAAGDRELVLGVADPLLDLPAIGRSTRRGRSPRARPGPPRAGRAPARRRSPTRRRRRRRARSRGRGSPGRSRGRSRTRARRRRRPDGCASSPPSASRSAARGGRARRSPRSGRGRSASPPRPRTRRRRASRARPRTSCRCRARSLPTPPRAACRARPRLRSRRPCRRPAREGRRACPR